MGRERKGIGRGGTREEKKKSGAGRQKQTAKKSKIGFKNKFFKAPYNIIWLT